MTDGRGTLLHAAHSNNRINVLRDVKCRFVPTLCAVQLAVLCHASPEQPCYVVVDNPNRNQVFSDCSLSLSRVLSGARRMLFACVAELVWSWSCRRHKRDNKWRPTSRRNNQVNGREVVGRAGDKTLYFVLGKQPKGQFPPGWDLLLTGMCVGESRVISVPPLLGYGAQGMPRRGVPPNATLLYDVKLIGVNGVNMCVA